MPHAERFSRRSFLRRSSQVAGGPMLLPELFSSGVLTREGRPAPSLTSNHITGKAVDMDITWTGPGYCSARDGRGPGFRRGGDGPGQRIRRALQP
jgi:hypothetical protein